MDGPAACSACRMENRPGTARRAPAFERDLKHLERDYLYRVELASKWRNGEKLLNGSLSHAAAIIKQMIGDADRSVSILSRNLDPRLYGRNRTLATTARFLDENPGEMRIILEEKDSDELSQNSFVRRFKDHPRVKFRFIPIHEQSRYKFHFLVADGDTYRFEPDKAKTTAVVAFGDMEGGSNLELIFETLWNRSRSENAVGHCKMS